MTTPKFSEDPTKLTFELEDYGYLYPVDDCCEHIAPYLRHEKTYVREGAVLGLAGHIYDARVRRIIEETLLTETNPQLVKLINSVLED